MPAFGADLHGGWSRRLYVPGHAPVLWWSLAVAVLLVLLNGLLQFGFGVAIGKILGLAENESFQSLLLGILPAGLVTALAALLLVRVKGGNARQHLALGLPQVGWLGWIVLPVCFVALIYALVTVLTAATGVDPQDYLPSADKPGEAGLVKEAIFGIAAGPWFWVALPGIVLGAPLAEELTFRGQLFSSLAATRLGALGATIFTSALWSLLHFTEPLLNVAMIFGMGLVLGWVLVRFGSLWLCIACHAAWNFAIAVAVKGMVE